MYIILNIVVDNIIFGFRNLAYGSQFSDTRFQVTVLTALTLRSRECVRKSVRTGVRKKEFVIAFVARVLANHPSLVRCERSLSAEGAQYNIWRRADCLRKCTKNPKYKIYKKAQIAKYELCNLYILQNIMFFVLKTYMFYEKFEIVLALLVYFV